MFIWVLLLKNIEINNTITHYYSHNTTTTSTTTTTTITTITTIATTSTITTTTTTTITQNNITHKPASCAKLHNIIIVIKWGPLKPNLFAEHTH